MITANTLNTRLLYKSATHAVVQGTLVVNGAFAGLANATLVNAIAIPGATMTLTANADHVDNAALFVVGTELTGNTSNAIGTVISVSGPTDNVYSFTVEMVQGTFANAEYIIAGDVEDDPEAELTAVANLAKVAVESIEFSTSGTVELSYANNEAIGAFTGNGKSHHSWVKRGADADPNVLLTTRGVASNGTATVIATVRKVSGFTGNY